MTYIVFTPQPQAQTYLCLLKCSRNHHPVDHVIFVNGSSSSNASGRDLQERALQEHGDLAHLARQLAAEKAMEKLVEYSLHQPVARGGYCCMSLLGVLEKNIHHRNFASLPCFGLLA